MVKKSLIPITLVFICIVLNHTIAYAQSPGDVLGHWHGEPIYYNGKPGSSDALNGQYQCTELIMRYFKDNYGYSPDLWKGKPAAGFFDIGNHPPEFDQVYDSTGLLPQQGDVLVFGEAPGWELGHVALVTGVSDNNVSFVQQNVGSNWQDSLPIDPNSRIRPERGYPKLIGWLHRRSAVEQIVQQFSNAVGLLSPAPESENSAQIRPATITPSGSQPNLVEPGGVPQKLPIITVVGVTITPQSSLGKPSLSSPGNGADMTQDADVALSWNALSGAAQYKVELWGGPYTGVMIPCDWQGGTSCTIHKMWPGTMSWHVKARGANGQESDWSDTWSFTIASSSIPPIITVPPASTNPPPDQFHLISPSGDVQLSNGTLPNLQWQSTSDPDGDQVQYDVIIDNANSPGARQPGQPDHVDSGLLTGTSWQPTGFGLEKGGRYTWYVLADDGHGNRTGSIEHWQFTIALPHISAYDPCPAGVGPGGIKPGSYPPTTLSQQQRQWLFEIFGNKGIASDGYGGQDCGKSPPPPVLPPPPTNTSTPTLAPAIVPARPISATPTNTKVPPTYTPTFTPTSTNTPVPPPPCPSGVGPGGIKPGSYPPTSLTQAQRQWLFNIFGHTGIASDGYGGENCR